MRWPVLLTIALSVVAIGVEQRPVLGQLFPGLARGCGGCGSCDTCVPPRIMRRMCRRCFKPSCVCPPVIPPAPCAPPPVCPTYETRMHPRRVVNYTMVPKTVCRREAYCETVPVTTYKQVVITVPQTEYRSVMRHRMVADQVMVPQKCVSTVWEPRLHRTFRPVCPMPCPPVAPPILDGCTTDIGTHMYGSPEIMPQTTPMPQTYPSQPTLTVPSTPYLSTPQENRKVPNPMEDPAFKPTNPGDSQSYYTPWQSVPSRSQYFEGTAEYDGYRTLGSGPVQTAHPGGKFQPAPSASTVWQYRK